MKRLIVMYRVERIRQAAGSILFLIALTLFSLGLFVATPVAKGDDQQCTICHCPPGNPDNCHTLTVGCSAVDAHLKNHPGDCLGPCPCQPTPVGNP